MERTGYFSLYYLSNPPDYEPLFNSRSPETSYTLIQIDGRTRQLGSRSFRPRLENYDGNPAFVFESSSITVTQVFSPVQTPNSSVVNGVMITYTIHNTGSQNHSVGLRVLIDTNMLEGRRMPPFTTNARTFSNETFLEAGGEDRYWINQGARVSLMGSIVNPIDTSAVVPDVHFANWGRLDNASWNLRFSRGRSFRNDPAVCYIFQPALLESGGSFTYSIFLTSEDIAWYDIKPQPLAETAGIPPAGTPGGGPAANMDDANILILKELQGVLNQFIYGEIDLGEQDLLEIEAAIERHRNSLR